MTPFRLNSRCINRCILSCTINRTSNAFVVVPLALLWITTYTKNFTLTSVFQLGRFCIHLHAYVHCWDHSALLCTFYMHSHLQSQLHLEELLVTFLCSSRLLTAPSSVPWFTSICVSFIVLELHYIIICLD